MQSRVCVQNFDNGDIQGFLYIDNGSGETLASTSARQVNGTPGASFFTMSGVVGLVSVTADVDVGGAQVDFSIVVGGASASLITRSLAISAASC